MRTAHLFRTLTEKSSVDERQILFFSFPTVWNTKVVYFLDFHSIMYYSIYIDITAALRAVLNIARACACNILYLHEGASPRRRYFRIARRAQRARVLYDSSALEARNDIVYIHERALLKCSCNATN